MKKTFTILNIEQIVAIICCFVSIYGQAQTSWEWSKNIHTTADNIGKSKLCVGNNNNILLAGSFSEMINISGNNYYGNDPEHAFLASFLPNGQLQWFKKSGDPLNYNPGTGIQMKNLFSMPNNDIVSFGFYSSKLIFDNITIRDHQFHPSGSFSHFPIFAFRFNPAGNIISAINITSYEHLEFPVACTDNSGNIYISAFYNDSVFINNTDTLLPSSTYSFFIAKFNNNDSLINIIEMTSPSVFNMSNILCDQNGDLIICGQAANMISVDGFQIGYNNTQYCYIARLSNSGSLIGWTGFYVGFNEVEVNDIKILNDKIYFTGILYNDSVRFHNTYTVYSDTIHNYNLLYGYTTQSLDTMIFQTNLGHGSGVKLIGGLSGSVYLYLQQYWFEYDPFFGYSPLPLFKIMKLDSMSSTIWSSESTVSSYFSFAYDMVRTSYDDLLITGLIGDVIGFGANVYSNTSGQSLFLAKLNQVSNISFNGYVYNNFTPVPNTLVEFLRFGGNSKTSPIGSCLTDNSGHYIYNDSITGNYYMRAIPNVSLSGAAITYPSSYAQWFNSTGIQATGDTMIFTDILFSQYGTDSGSNSFHGYITDPYGNPIPQIKVNLTDNSGIIYKSALTDNFGFYSLDNVSISNYNILVDQPFLPLLNYYTPTNYLTDYNYRIFPNFIDTGSQYLPQPIDTIGIYISSCQINPTMPIDSAFATVSGYAGNQVIIDLQILLIL